MSFKFSDFLQYFSTTRFSMFIKRLSKLFGKKVGNNIFTLHKTVFTLRR